MFKTGILSVSIVGVFALAFFLILKPVHSKRYLMSKNTKLDSSLSRILELFGGDILALLPEKKIQSMSSNRNLDILFRKSKNPWGVNHIEFTLLKYVLCVLFFIFGTILGGILYLGCTFFEIDFMTWMAFVFPPVMMLIGYNYPNLHYQSVADKREMEIKKTMAEAIDYLTMVIAGGGYSLNIAFEKVTPYLTDGVVKEEFEIIVNDLYTGKTMEATLNDFAYRVPNDGVQSFALALNNANAQSVPMGDILKNQSKSMRKEREQVLSKIISQLSTKVMLCLAPASAFSIILVALTPTAYSLMNMLKK